MKKESKSKFLITGSSRGIGASVARLSKKYGYEVILHGRTKSKSLLNIAKELDSDYLYFDITKEDQIKSGLNKLSHINALVNSAGINISKSFEQLTNSDWNKTYSSNVIGLSNVIKYSLPKLRNSKTLTRVVNIASIKGTYSAVGRVAYASSKAAVINLTSGLAKEFAPNILVNAVSPGFTETDMTTNSWSNRIEKQVESILLRRMASTNEIAELVIFLCSDKNTYITGQNINVDGGFSIKNI